MGAPVAEEMLIFQHLFFYNSYVLPIKKTYKTNFYTKNLINHHVDILLMNVIQSKSNHHKKFSHDFLNEISNIELYETKKALISTDLMLISTLYFYVWWR